MKMKLFQFVQKCYAILGITLDQSKQKYPFNWRILTASLCYDSSCIFLLIPVKQAITMDSKFADFAECVFVFAANNLVGICYVITIFCSSKLFAFIDNCEEIADKSK